MKFIEQGWINYRKLCIRAATPQKQLDEARQAYFAGAAILYTTIMRSLSPGLGETDGDLRVMQDLQTEIDAFGQALDAKVLKGDPDAMRGLSNNPETMAPDMVGTINCPKCGHSATVAMHRGRPQ